MAGRMSVAAQLVDGHNRLVAEACQPACIYCDSALTSPLRHAYPPCSGHWVLSFPDGDRAASAAQHVDEWAHKMRAVYCQLLSPLLHASEDPVSSSGSDSGSAGRPPAGGAQQAGSGSDCGSAQEAAAPRSPGG